jgi:phosphatidylinositol alpha-mannosyltransferase
MRIALVSPYSWTYPGGVTRHIQALAEQFIAGGHEVRVLAPSDPPGRFSTALHRGAAPQRLDTPGYVLSLGRTVGFKANGAVSNLSVTAYGVSTLHRELRSGGYDVVHIHEPVAPVIGWVAADWTRLPLVGTFHTYNENRFSNGIAVAIGARRVLNHLHVRIAVSQAAAWTARRFFGGHYRIIPNGVQVDPLRARAAARRETGDRLRLVFVGQAVERKGLPLLLRAFEALRDHVPAELTVIGPTRDELVPMMLDSRGVRVLGKVDDATKQRELEQADLLCAPSLGGESFGMVLTEAFAAGTPVVCSDIAGYRDVVANDRTGILVPRGDAQALAEALRDVWEEPERRRRLARGAAEAAERYAWPRVAGEVLQAYEEAIATPAPVGLAQRAAVALGVRPADLKPHEPARKLVSLDPQAVSRRSRLTHIGRRLGLSALSGGAVVLAVLALRRIGVGNVLAAIATSTPSFLIAGLLVMCGAMAARAVSWRAILQAALPRSRVTLIDAMQGTFIGVLMSSTLPARLGEPARAMVVARRTGHPRETFPVVLGTVVSQTLLNLLALAILGAIMFSSVNIFSGHEQALLAATIAPFVLLLLIVVLPAVLRHRATQRFRRLQALARVMRTGITRVRDGLQVFRHPRLGGTAAVAQLGAWALQSLSCYLLLIALGLSHRVGFGGAAAVLFAVNITALVPATPANLGVFQAACAAVLHAGWHVGVPTGVAYGVILQAVEFVTALMMGLPALLREGMSWKEVRLRASNAAPVRLPPRAVGAVVTGSAGESGGSATDSVPPAAARPVRSSGARSAPSS